MSISHRLFKNPTGEYRPIPFWFWNDRMENEELGRQLEEMKNAGVYEAFMHSRQGRITPYLSEEWFDRIGFTIGRAKELGMRVWLYDEDNWPSGYAGGRVLEADPSYRAKHLAREGHEISGPSKLRLDLPEGDLIAVLACPLDADPTEATEITRFVSNGKLEWDVPAGEWGIHCFLRRWTHWHPAYNEGWYVDLLDRDAVDCFIETTHEEHRKRFPEAMGETVLGIFTDEPGFYNNLWNTDHDTIPWTARFPQIFKEAKGYDLIPKLIAMWEGKGIPAARARYDYYDVLASLFRESFFRPIYDWCEKTKLQSLGHVTIEEELKYHPRMFGSFFRTMEYFHIPGVDQICQTDFGSITPKLGSSAAHAFGRERCFSETFGVYNWKLTLEEMKWVTDWQYVRGINFFVPHAFYYSTRDERVRECPPSEFFQNTFWPHFRHYADYVGRMSYLLSRGVHVADIAVYYPAASVWAEITPVDSEEVDKLDASFKRLSNWLLSNQRDFDYLDDDALARADIESGEIRLHGEKHSILVLPAARYLPEATLRAILRFCESGGMLLAFGRSPEGFSTAESELVAALFGDGSLGVTRPVGSGKVLLLDETEESLLAALATHPLPADVEISPGCPEINVLDRQIGDTKVYYLASRTAEPQRFVASFRASGSASLWDPETGQGFPVAAEPILGGRQRIALSLAGYGSLFVVFGEASEYHVPKRPDLALRMASLDPVRRIELPDEWEITVQGRIAPQKISLKSWTDLGIPDYSGAASYRTEFEWSGEESAWALWLDFGDVRNIAELSLNGVSLGSRPWRPFGFDVTDHLRPGTNQIELKVTNTPSNELESQPLESGLLGPVSICLLQPPRCCGRID